MVMKVQSRFTSLLGSVFLLGALGLAGTATASPINVGLDFTGADWGTSEITGVGQASWANDGGVAPPNRLRLTNNSGAQRGNAWYNAATVEANAAWNAEFTFQITYEHSGGADGLAFHLHEIGIGADTWIEGQGLGPNFLSVVIDTWNNGGECDFGLKIFNDGAGVGNCHNLSGLGSVADDVYQVVMAYDGNGALTVDVINTATSNSTGALGFAADLSTLNNATFGWSAHTGGAGENHDIRTMSGTFVPEPGTALLVGLGLAGLSLGRRARG